MPKSKSKKTIPDFTPREAVLMTCLIADKSQPACASLSELMERLLLGVRTERFLKHVATINHVNVPELCKKLDEANEDLPKILADLLCTGFQSEYGFADNGLPSKSALGRMGLIAQIRPAAWGFCVARDRNYGCDEIVMRHPQLMTRYHGSDVTLEEAVQRMADITNAIRDQGRSTLHKEQQDTAYLIAALSGLRYFRIESGIGGGLASLHEIPWYVLAREFDNRDLKGLTIAGVNAPDWVATLATCS